MPRNKLIVMTVSALLISTSGAALAMDKPLVPLQDTHAHPVLINATANQEEDAKGFISALADEGLGLLSQNEMTDEKRQKEFRKLLQRNFDMKTIARFALGRYWKSASAAEQKEYLKLFEDMIVKVYSRRFEDYDGQDLVVKDARPSGERDTIVQSEIVPKNGPAIQVDWRVRNKNGKLSVIDIIVEGVSMSLTQRSDFASVIQRGGGQVEVLLAHLRTEDQQ